MTDKEDAPTSRKRVAGTQINKDNPEPGDDGPEQEMGTFQRASEEVMATRRIVKVRRQQQSSAPPSNPFSAIRFTPSDSTVETSVPVTEPQPHCVVTAPNARDSSCSDDKTGEGTNGNGKDALSEIGKDADSNEISEPGKDESAVRAKIDVTTGTSTQSVETNDKAQDGIDGSVSEAKDVGQKLKEDASKTAEVESETKDGETEEKKGANEAGVEDQVSKGDTEGKDGDELEAKKGVDETGDKDQASKDDTEQKDRDELEAKDGSSEEKKDADKKGQSSSAPLFSFQNLSSSQNAFTGLAGTGFSSSSFSFGSASKESSQFANAGPLFGLNSDSSSFPSFSFGTTNNGTTSPPALATAVEAPKKLAMPEVPVETGEENEKAVFTADAALYEYIDAGWKERGKGELKLNIPVSGNESSRLIMRTKGNYRLILNASLYADMSLKDMDKKGVTFACVNSIGEVQSGLTTVALKFKDAGIRDEFSDAVAMHKTRKAPDALKTPENSPKASED